MRGPNSFGNARHGVTPQKEFDHYLRNNFVFDTAGFCGAIGAVKGALIEIPAARIVFATDYPQEIRERSAVHDFVKQLRALGNDEGNVIPDPANAVLDQGRVARAVGGGAAVPKVGNTAGIGARTSRRFGAEASAQLTRGRLESRS